MPKLKQFLTKTKIPNYVNTAIESKQNAQTEINKTHKPHGMTVQIEAIIPGFAAEQPKYS